jgi:glycosyltransferase involved in cell wall biosynthesis
MKIAMIGLKGVPFPAGIENFTEQIGWRLVERGHEVTVYVRPYVEVGDEYRGMRIRRLPSVDTKHLDAISHTALAALHLLTTDVDIAHFHALGPSTLSFVPRLRGIKTIAHVHGLDWERAKWGRFARTCLKAGEYAAVRFPNRCLSISESLRAHLSEKYGRSVEYVPTGVDDYEPRPAREIARWGLESDGYILFLGRLVPEKGCHYLIEAHRKLDPDKKLVIAGPPSHSEEYARELRAMAGDAVVFTGAVYGDALHELFSNAYLYVLPSDLEGLPHSLLQAMSFGTCVLASDIEANREAMRGCGLEFRRGDVDDLREKMAHALENEDFVRAQAGASKQVVRDHYGWEAVVDRLEEIYRDCLGA